MLFSPGGAYNHASRIGGISYSLYKKVSTEFRKVKSFTLPYEGEPVYYPQEQVFLEWSQGPMRNLTQNTTVALPTYPVTVNSNPPRRYVFVREAGENNPVEVDIVKGQATPLKAATWEFIRNSTGREFQDDNWIHLFVSPDGTTIIRCSTDHSNNTITIATWDVVRDQMLFEPRSVEYPTDIRAPKIALCTMIDGEISALVTDNEFDRVQYPVSVIGIRINAAGLAKTVLPKMPLGEFSGSVVQEDLVKFSVLYRDFGDDKSPDDQGKMKPPPDRYRLRQYSLTSGECLYSEVIDIPQSLP